MSDSVIVPTQTVSSLTDHVTDATDSCSVSTNGHCAINGNGAAHMEHAENTTAAAADAGATSTGEPPTRVAQAEQTIDKFATRVASFTSYLGKSFLWAGSRVKEAAADFWAEAQSVRHGDQP